MIAAIYALACSRLDAGDVEGFFLLAGNHDSLDLVVHNVHELRARGLYERALLHAFTATRGNNHRIPTDLLRALFEGANRERLRALGDPLPGPGLHTLYRGVAGRPPARRVRGLSWTSDFDRARWFAERASSILPDPAVYEVTVEDHDVAAYTNDREEQEFVVLLPPSARPRRVWPGSNSGS